MSHSRTALIVVMAAIMVLLFGCASTKVSIYQRQAEFIEAEYTPYGESGASSIVGQAFVKDEGGIARYAAGGVILMNPVTTYSTEWFEVAILQHRAISGADPRVWGYHREVTADEKGNFEFKDLAAGEYYLATIITWEEPSKSGSKEKSAWVGIKVKVGPGETAKVALTQ